MASVVRNLPQIQMVKYRGIFDFPGLLRLIYKWGVDQGYEVHERKYKHKVPDVRGAEQEVTIYGWRKLDAYVKFWFNVDIKAEYLKDVDVIIENRKKRLTQGKVRILFGGHVELDYNDLFGGSKFMRSLRDFYHKFIIRTKIQNILEDTLYYRLYKLNMKVKEHLDMEGKHYASIGRW